MTNPEQNPDKKTYDIKIIKWLFEFARPWRVLLALSLLFMIATAGLELLVPYITKIAVDKYIYPSWRVVEFDDDAKGKEISSDINARYPGLVLSMGGGKYLIDLSELSSVDRNNIEKTNKVEDQRYLVVNPSAYTGERKTAIKAIIREHPALFDPIGESHYISHSEMETLSPSDIRVLRAEQLDRVKVLALYLFCALLGVFVFSTLYTYLLNYSGHNIMHRIRTRVYAHTLSLPQDYFDKNPVGRLTTRVTNDVNAINEMYTSVMVQFCKDILVVIGVLAVMFYMNRKLTIFIFLLTILMGFFAGLFRMKLKSVYRRVRISIAKLNAFVQESIRGIVLIKLYKREMENFEKFKNVNSENFKANMDQLWVYATFRPFIEFTSIFAVAFILWYGGLLVTRFELTLGALIAYLYYVRMLFRPIQELAERYNIFQSATAASENLYELYHVEPEQREGADVEGIGVGLEFKNVWFSYDKEEWVLKDLSFKIEPGETVALVGLTGSGKTTIVNLILRFYDIDRGEILLGGVNIREYDPRNLRAHVSAVFQDVFLFAKELDDGENTKNVELVTNTRLSEMKDQNGTSLSSGEKQIVSLGHAFSKQAELLILDEATSHIDAEIESKVQKAIANEGRDRTTLIIAHRLSNVRNADKIYVIHEGEIAEHGTHQELLAKQGIYHNLYELQSELSSFSREPK